MKNSYIIDQKFDDLTSDNLGCNINEGFIYAGQTFTAGITGDLVAISVHIRSKRSLNPDNGFKHYNLQIAIYSTENGYPSEELSNVLLEKDESLIDEIIELKKPVFQEKGRQYAIIANYPDGPKHGAGEWLGVWSGSTDNKYPKGNLFAGNGGDWFGSSINNHDVFFRTYIEKSA